MLLLFFELLFNTAWPVVPEPAKKSKTISLELLQIQLMIRYNKSVFFSVSKIVSFPLKEISIQLSLSIFPSLGGT